MEHNQDFRSDIDMWASMWDEMQGKKIHPAPQKPEPAPYSGVGTPQDTYYDYLDGESEELFSEEKTPNPVYPDSVGKDQDNPEPVWVSESLLREVESLKKRLYAVENRMARMGQGKKWTEKVVKDDGKKLMSEIESIKKRIDRVSNTLGIKKEPSPWQVKRD